MGDFTSTARDAIHAGDGSEGCAINRQARLVLTSLFALTVSVGAQLHPTP